MFLQLHGHVRLVVVLLHSTIPDCARGIQNPGFPEPTAVSLPPEPEGPHKCVSCCWNTEHIPRLKVCLGAGMSRMGEEYWNKLGHKGWGVYAYEHEAP